MFITILLPSLNEEKGIAETIKAIPIERLKKAGYRLEILVVDGGSTDRTREAAKNLGAKVHRAQRGYGRQYLFGFRNARGKIIITADSDGSYPMEKIPDYLKVMKEKKLDFISTNRFAQMKPGSMRKLNRFGNWLLTWLANRLFGLNLKDSQSGMWLFRREALKKMKLTSPGMALSEEIKIEAFTKLKAMELPSSYEKRVGDSKLMRFRDGWGNLKFLFKKKFQEINLINLIPN